YLGALDPAGRLAGLLALRVTDRPGGMHLYDLGSLVRPGLAGDAEQLYPHLVGAVSGAHCVLRARDAEVSRHLVLAARDLADREGRAALGLLYLDRATAAEVGVQLAAAPVLVAAEAV